MRESDVVAAKHLALLHLALLQYISRTCMRVGKAYFSCVQARKHEIFAEFRPELKCNSPIPSYAKYAFHVFYASYALCASVHSMCSMRSMHFMYSMFSMRFMHSMCSMRSMHFMHSMSSMRSMRVACIKYFSRSRTLTSEALL